jgi:hypothetical protein
VQDQSDASAVKWPIVIDEGGSNTPNGHNTVLKGARTNGNLGLNRGDSYDRYPSGIEHNCDSASDWIVADGVRVDNMLDGYRLKARAMAT